MKSHILRFTTKGVNQRGQTLYTAHCQLGCWSGAPMTADAARTKQSEHVEAVAGVMAQDARERAANV